MEFESLAGSDGTVYAGVFDDDSSGVVALDKTNGTERWQFEVNQPWTPAPSQSGGIGNRLTTVVSISVPTVASTKSVMTARN